MKVEFVFAQPISGWADGLAVFIEASEYNKAHDNDIEFNQLVRTLELAHSEDVVNGFSYSIYREIGQYVTEGSEVIFTVDRPDGANKPCPSVWIANNNRLRRVKIDSWLENNNVYTISKVIE